jgi:hypothetical protein
LVVASSYAFPSSTLEENNPTIIIKNFIYFSRYGSSPVDLGNESITSSTMV